MSYYVASTPSHHHRSRTLSHSGYGPQPMAYSTSQPGQYYPSTPGAYSYDGHHRSRSLSRASNPYYTSTPLPYSSTVQAPTYLVAPSPSHHHRSHSSHRHKRSHSTSSHRHRHSSRPRDSGRHHHSSGHHRSYSTSQYYGYQPTIGDRIRNFFGFGPQSRARYVDPRTGREVDRSGRPIIRY
ncbi:hypothetical protein DENSPDRAFT_876315 [Dentipellis sp. KUC8613]|nr:hypothetical protein DENSPDRAFT_876315 [Dentipellis sp. KUC8613]